MLICVCDICNEKIDFKKKKRFTFLRTEDKIIFGFDCCNVCENKLKDIFDHNTNKKELTDYLWWKIQGISMEDTNKFSQDELDTMRDVLYWYRRTEIIKSYREEEQIKISKLESKILNMLKIT